MAISTVLLRHAGREFRAVVHADGRVDVDGQEFHVRGGATGEIRVEGRPDATMWVAVTPDVRWVFANGRVFDFTVAPRHASAPRRATHHGSLMAPMPATVRRVQVVVGQTIARGDTLIVLEAMKMELPIKATANGRIEAIRCQEGELVQPGVPLIEIEELESAPAGA